MVPIQGQGTMNNGVSGVYLTRWPFHFDELHLLGTMHTDVYLYTIPGLGVDSCSSGDGLTSMSAFSDAFLVWLTGR
jgi:hypothetical protein